MATATAILPADTPPAIAATPHPRTKKLHMSRFKSAETARNVWCATPEEGTPWASVLDRSYWIGMLNVLRPCDKIEVINDEMTYYAELLVVSKDQLGADVVLLRKEDLSITTPQAIDSGFEIVWKGPTARWSVMRTADRQLVKTHFETREHALRWQLDNPKVR